MSNEFSWDRRRFIGSATMSVAVTQLGANRRAEATAVLPIEGTLPSLAGAVEWLNTPPLSVAALRGKVVVVEFWTYTCVNWRRTLPYVRAWADKYKDRGVVVIGVHTPEFGFEREVANVRQAVKQIGITFPVAVDSGYAIWSAFGNEYWPALYFVDAQGRIRHHQFGEGGYEESERVIQQLLAEAGHPVVSPRLVSVNPTGVEVPADWATLNSPETYLGYERSETFASTGGAVLDRHHVYGSPVSLGLNQWALEGMASWSSHGCISSFDNPGSLRIGSSRFSFSSRGLPRSTLPSANDHTDHGNHLITAEMLDPWRLHPSRRVTSNLLCAGMVPGDTPCARVSRALRVSSIPDLVRTRTNCY